MKSNFKVGQTVYCVLFGEGVVHSIEYETVYPIEVEFGDENYRCYTADGRYVSDANRTLFFTKPEVQGATEPVFEPQLKEGDKIVTKYRNVYSVQTVQKEDSTCVYVFPTEEDPEEGSYFQKDEVQFFKLGEEIKF